MPYFSFTGVASAPPDEVRKKLEAHVSPPPRWFRFARPPTAFEGRVDRERFAINRVIRGRDSFNPWIRGTIRSGPSGTIVEARLTLHPVVWCLLALFSWFLGRPPMEADPAALGMLLFLWAMAVGFFYFNAVKVKKLMFELLDLRAS